MKRKPKELVLSKETVRLLRDPELRLVTGGRSPDDGPALEKRQKGMDGLRATATIVFDIP